MTAKLLANVYLLLLIFFLLPVYANPPILLKADNEQSASFELGSRLEVLEDKDGTLTVEDVASSHYSDKFMGQQATRFGVKFTQSVYWSHFDILNQSDETDWYFISKRSLTQDEQLYLFSGNQYQPYTLLKEHPHSKYPVYHLALPKGSRYQLYIRSQDLQTSLDLSFHINSSAQMLNAMATQYPLYGAVLGGLLSLVVYNLLLFLHLKDRQFLVLSLFITALSLEIGMHTGVFHFFELPRTYLPSMGTTFGFIAIASGISVFAGFTNIKKQLPGLYRIFRVLFWLACLLIPVATFLPYSLLWVGLIAFFVLALAVITRIRLMRQGFTFHLSHQIAFAIVMVALLPSLLRIIGFLEKESYLTDIVFPALLLMSIFLSISQAEQTRKIREKAERTASAGKAKDEFLTTMSHELRTPMNAVIGAGSLLNATQLNSRQRNIVEKLKISSHHMLDLIDNILDLARLDGSKLQLENIPFDLNEKLHSIQQLLEEKAKEKKLSLRLENAFISNKQLIGDPTRLVQVLINLLDNAIRFTEKGEVTLSIVVQKTRGERGKGQVRLLFKVSDTGIGIPPMEQRNIFQRFSQAESSTSRRYGGSGLGLAISYQLVELMGGKLEVASESGKGSAFFFTLNFEQYVKEVMPVFTPEEQNSLSGIRILLVDDDEINQYIGRELLQTEGIIVEFASTGKKALQLIQEQAFDLVFMDISMPGMDGYETTKHIRKSLNINTLPVVALTAHAITGERERCLESGMDDYLTKPFQLEELTTMVRKRIATR